MRRTRLWRQNMILAIYLRLEDEMNIVACLDNNQKGHPMKYQRFGTFNWFIKVTGCVLKKFYSNLDQNQIYIESVSITYTNQDIPSPTNMPLFEKYNFNKTFQLKVMIKVNEKLDSEKITSNISNDHPDFSGERMIRYKKFCYMMLSCNLLQITTSGCYTQHNKSTRLVSGSPQKWSNNSINTVPKTMHLIKYNIFFQKQIVSNKT